MLKVGDRAPDFEAPTTSGGTLRFSDLRGKRVVVFFFPKAFTTGCSIETARFHAVYPEIQDLGAEVIGVSTDDHETQCSFASAQGASFPMIGDADKTICKAFGVLVPVLGFSRRISFVIDEQGMIRDVLMPGTVVGRAGVDKHVDEIRASLARLGPLSSS